MLHLVFMGKFRALVPDSLGRVEPPPSVTTLEGLRHWIAAEVPALDAALANGPFKLIHNHAVVHDLSTPFAPGDEIAFLPPMSGG